MFLLISMIGFLGMISKKDIRESALEEYYYDGQNVTRSFGRFVFTARQGPNLWDGTRFEVEGKTNNELWYYHNNGNWQSFTKVWGTNIKYAHISGYMELEEGSSNEVWMKNGRDIKPLMRDEWNTETVENYTNVQFKTSINTDPYGSIVNLDNLLTHCSQISGILVSEKENGTCDEKSISEMISRISKNCYNLGILNRCVPNVDRVTRKAEDTVRRGYLKMMEIAMKLLNKTREDDNAVVKNDNEGFEVNVKTGHSGEFDGIYEVQETECASGRCIRAKKSGLTPEDLIETEKAFSDLEEATERARENEEIISTLQREVDEKTNSLNESIEAIITALQCEIDQEQHVMMRIMWKPIVKIEELCAKVEWLHEETVMLRSEITHNKIDHMEATEDLQLQIEELKREVSLLKEALFFCESEDNHEYKNVHGKDDELKSEMEKDQSQNESNEKKRCDEWSLKWEDNRVVSILTAAWVSTVLVAVLILVVLKCKGFKVIREEKF